MQSEVKWSETFEIGIYYIIYKYKSYIIYICVCVCVCVYVCVVYVYNKMWSNKAVILHLFY